MRTQAAAEARAARFAKGVRVARQQLARMPETVAVRELGEALGAIESELDGWTRADPTPHARDDVMRRILLIHVAIAKLLPRGLARPER